MTDVQKFWEENKMDFPVKVYHDRIETKHNKIYTKMIKTVTHIDCPKEWESLNDWDSHRPLLWLGCKNALLGFPITEFGCGEGSTKLIYDFRKNTGGNFFSYETNEVYADKYKKYVTKVNDYLEVHLSEPPFNQALLFIDCAPAELRKPLIEKHKDHADIIIIHDTEIGSNYVYNLANTLAEFKYRLHYAPKGKPHTTAVSNTIDVTQWV